MTLGPFTVDPGDAIWIRRPDVPTHNPNVSEADRKFAEQEYRAFYHCIAYTLETLPVWCINRFSAARFIHNKAVQLNLARACGLQVPETLLSNSPSRIREFVDRNPDRTIGKGFSPHVWQREHEGSVSVTQTFELTPGALPADEVLTYTPGIYQEKVVKQFDIRMVIMGQQGLFVCSAQSQKGAGLAAGCRAGQCEGRDHSHAARCGERNLGICPQSEDLFRLG